MLDDAYLVGSSSSGMQKINVTSIDQFGTGWNTSDSFNLTTTTPGVSRSSSNISEFFENEDSQEVHDLIEIEKLTEADEIQQMLLGSDDFLF